ncbi:dihydrodipicolinate synthase family protein [Pelagicoccus enzymogenes]|uniref:dihydrodipicolinate synthase family protein n=1 Tax=Pelagicoccus enzymogenes TaxID=2773457 RepID=UPI00280E6F60|nr:dihydrodipicolinate synthase family protein [Pelagicoccus enzymogenes]MDQ8197708.1 dihydrodipicolinate synthase family protein [Pelagicoccus enzymogenes]
MNTNLPTEGVLAALCLPVGNDGQLLEPALEAHLSWLRSKGIHGVLALGSTGEFPLMSVDERKEALDTVLKLAGDLPVIANISDINPKNVEALGRHAKAIGLPGVAVMPPSFYPVNAQEQLSFFLRVASAVELPVMLYNFPELTGNRIAPETVAAFAAAAPMFGIKQSGGEFAYHRELVAIGEAKGFSVYSGADTRLPEAFGLGVKAAIGGLVNFVPEYMVAIFEHCRKGKACDVDLYAARMKEVGAIIDRLSFPVNVGMGMLARGFEPGSSRTNVSAAFREEMNRSSEELRRLFEKWNLSVERPVSV